MARIVIYPYKMGSRSGRNLARAMGVPRVYPDRKFRPTEDDIIINWGNSRLPRWHTEDLSYVNHPEAVAQAVNKISCFQVLQAHGISIPEFTVEHDEALFWEGIVYARHKVTSHSANGLQIVRPEDIHFPRAPLYTKAIEGDGEYRVHVFDGKVIDYRKKSRRYDDTPTEDERMVRNLGTGWVFRSQNLRRLERIEQLAIDAVDALGLVFGAVDIIKDTSGNVYVLEVNCAPAMEEQTMDNYLEAIDNLINHG